MAKGPKYMEMEIDTKDSLLMDSLKVMDNIIGLMDQCLKEILNKVLEMVMDFGKVEMEPMKTIKDITCWIRSMDMEFITGGMVTYIKDSGWMIFGMDKENYYSIMK